MQPELFEDLQGIYPKPRRSQPPLFPSRFVRLRVAFEDLIFMGLSLVLLMLGGFCVGVERGKQLTLARAAPMGLSPVVLASAELSVPVFPQPLQPEVGITAGSEGSFAIQLASYIGSRAAQAEAHRLRQQGFKAEVVEQGKFFELRVSGYHSRNEALTQLVRLKRTYHDAFIKQLSPRKVFAKRQV